MTDTEEFIEEFEEEGLVYFVVIPITSRRVANKILRESGWSGWIVNKRILKRNLK